MKISQHVQISLTDDTLRRLPVNESAHLALMFGSTAMLSDAGLFRTVKERFPRAILLGCSTAGEIQGTRVLDDSLVVTAVEFAHTTVRLVSGFITDMEQSGAVGARLATKLPKDGLSHVFVLSDGLHVNGTALVEGLESVLSSDVVVTGGLAGDGALFSKTLVCADSTPAERQVAVLGFYGSRLSIGFGSLGGWDPFGPDRLVTRSRGNILYELDNQSALELYKKYLGPHAAGLPATGLLFPLALRSQDGNVGLVRTILAVNEADQSMTFAGDMPEGSYARLMKANFEHLIDGAVGAARSCHERLSSNTAELAILVSCVGRKLVLQQRIEEEVEGVRDVLGERTTLAGFYSYGEISPQTPSAKCELHNQTMTITTFAEG